MGDCLGHLPRPVFNWFGESEVMSKCRRCSRKAGGGDSWHPLLRTDSQELFSTVKYTKEKEGDDQHRNRGRGRFTRCHSDPEGNLLQGESSGEESDPGICTTNRAQHLDLCTCDESSEPESGGQSNMLSALSRLTQTQSYDYCYTPEDSDCFWDAETSGGEKDNDQDSPIKPGWGLKSLEVSQKMSSQPQPKSSNSTLNGAGGDNGNISTGNDSAILSMESSQTKKHYLTEESEQLSHLLFSGPF